MVVPACVVGIKAPESLCYLLMYLNPTLNKDYLLYVTRSLVLCVCFVDRCLLLYRLHMHMHISYTNMQVITHSIKIIQYIRQTQ
jgi:hypothetical protein